MPFPGTMHQITSPRFFVLWAALAQEKHAQRRSRSICHRSLMCRGITYLPLVVMAPLHSITSPWEALSAPKERFQAQLVEHERCLEDRAVRRVACAMLSGKLIFRTLCTR